MRSILRRAEMASATVPFGEYVGYSLAQMQAELADYRAKMAENRRGGLAVTSASVNGSSFTYGPGMNLSPEQWIAEIQSAMAWLDDAWIDLPNEAVGRFA